MNTNEVNPLSSPASLLSMSSTSKTSGIIHMVDEKGKSDFKWSSNETKKMLDLYASYKDKVGTMQIKTHKQLWQIISTKLKEEMNIEATEHNCHNRWRVLERNYKKYIDNENSTGRRKFFEFAKEMEAIIGGRETVRPELLLSIEMVDPDIKDRQDVEEKEKPNKNIKDRVFTKRKSVLERMREDRKRYYTERLKIEREKLEVFRERNELIQERNKILKENQVCKCSHENNI